MSLRHDTYTEYDIKPLRRFGAQHWHIRTVQDEDTTDYLCDSFAEMWKASEALRGVTRVQKCFECWRDCLDQG